MSRKCYDLEGLRDALRLAQRAIKKEKSASVKKIVLHGVGIQVITSNGWHNSKIDEVEYWRALDYIEKYHPDGLAIDAHQAMNCII